jgi:peptide/nickel transport system substrate-binding protein
MKRFEKLYLFIVLIVVFTMLFSFTACGQKEEESGIASTETQPTSKGDPHKAEDIVVIAMALDISSLDPYAQNTTQTNALAHCIYDTLTFTDPATGDVSLELATSYEQVSDLEWIFNIREGIKFHNGAELTASDVKFSIERAMESKGMASKLGMIGHLEIIDDYAIKFVLKYPCVTLLNSLSFVCSAIMDEDFTKSNGDKFIPNGTGPYKFVEWSPGEHVILERNDDYWGELYGAKTLKTVVMSEDTSRTIALEAGDIDVNINVASIDFNRIDSNKDLTLYKDTNNKIDYLGLSHIDPITKDLKVRQAIAYAINKHDFVDVVLEGNGTVAESYLASGLEGHNPEQKGYQYDLAKAKNLMNEAGYPDGFDLTLTARSDRDNLLAQTLQGQLREIGINVIIERVENAVFLEKCGAGEIQASFGNWAGTTSDADNPLRGVFYGPNAGTNNRTWYQNPVMDELLDKAITVSDDNERAKIYHEVEKLIHDDVAVIPLFFEVAGIAAKNDIGGVFVPKIGDIVPYFYYHWKN